MSTPNPFTVRPVPEMLRVPIHVDNPLKATTVDGTRTYTRDNVTLSGSLSWQVP